MKHFTIRAVRSGRWWAITVDEERRAQTQAKRLDQVESVVRSVLVDLRVITSSEKVTLTVMPEMAELDALRTAAVESRVAAAELADAAAKAARRFASQAAASGLPVRDIGMMLGVSYQRAQQLIHDS